MRSRVMSFSASGLPKATRVIARLNMSSSARSAPPIWRMQWWMRPGPRRPWAISNPRPSPSNMLDTGTRTFSKSTSPWPCGASSYPNTVSMRITLIPGASRSTRIIDCCLHLSVLLGPDGRPAHHLAERRVLEVREPGPAPALGQKEVPEGALPGLGLQLLHDRRHLPAGRLAGELVHEGPLVGIDVLVHEVGELLE